jgi:hypothetical protein
MNNNVWPSKSVLYDENLLFSWRCVPVEFKAHTWEGRIGWHPEPGHNGLRESVGPAPGVWRAGTQEVRLVVGTINRFARFAFAFIIVGSTCDSCLIHYDTYLVRVQEQATLPYGACARNAHPDGCQ